MVAIAVFGLIMVLISLVMITKPDAWRRCIVRFCQMPNMHPLEITIRLGFGLLFLQYADDSKYPLIIKMTGYVLVAAGVGLIFLPPSYHRGLGIWAAEKLSRFFRPAGVASLAFGVVLIYAAV